MSRCFYLYHDLVIVERVSLMFGIEVLLVTSTYLHICVYNMKVFVPKISGKVDSR